MQQQRNSNICRLLAGIGLLFLSFQPLQAQDLVQVSGEFKQWHAVAVQVTCPVADCGEVKPQSDPNPFTDYRLRVTFTSEDASNVMDVPGFYAGDGNAAISESDSGNVWQVYFTPEQTGTWNYTVSFETGADLVLSTAAGTPLEPDGTTGTFSIEASDKTGNDFRSKGFLRHVNKSHFYFSGSDTPFLKNGAGSPENLLHYYQIHNTYQQDTIPVIPPHTFAPHLGNFNPGDPLWGPQKSKGTGLIGALNYLASLGVNSYYFVVHNTAANTLGQDTAVWPWLSPAEEDRDRFSVAKLAQWEMIFSHMDSLGISMNMVTQDRINQLDLDGGDLGRIRSLFYRELIARFGHHLGVVWNLGEENSATTEQIMDYANFIRGVDVYGHPIVSQANGTLIAHDRYYEPLLGFQNFEGASMQVGLVDFDSGETPSPPGKIHNAILKWVEASKAANQPWVVTLDEIGHWSDGIVPDGDPRDPTNRRARREGFWGTIMAGGAGSDWYYGSDPFEYNDIWVEDFSVREAFFQRTQAGTQMILDSGIPYWEMENHNELSTLENTWVLANEGEIYMVYSPFQEAFELKLPDGTYNILWYDAFNGGPLQEGTLLDVEVDTDSAWVSLGEPLGFEQDAVALVSLKRVSNVSNEEGANRGTQGPMLKQNYPNPVRQKTTIAFELPAAGQVDLNIYDMLGRQIKGITQGFLASGTHRYEVDLSTLSTGVYVYRLTVDGASYQHLLLRR
ncbi:MAG: DUF5060 domain-containing protein [Bacteroidota bacterium]